MGVQHETDQFPQCGAIYPPVDWPPLSHPAAGGEKAEKNRYPAGKDDMGLRYRAAVRFIDGKQLLNVEQLAANDGMTLDDFVSWFFKTSDTFEGVVIHFTDFRY